MGDFLHQLEARRAELIREYELKLAALDRLIALEGGIVKPETTIDIPPSRPILHVRTRGLDVGSLTSQIMSLMKEEPLRGWTSTEITKILRERPSTEHGAYRLSKDDLKSRNAVSAGMNELWRMGYIFRASPPSGPHPAVYRLNEKEAAEATP